MNTFYNMSNLSTRNLATRNSNYPTKTIAELAVNTDNLSTLVKALGVTNMVNTLSASGPFTVFAPSNAAFSRLGNEVLKKLIDNPNELSDILKNHIVLGKYFSNRLYDNQELRMENGKIIIIKIRGDNISLLNRRNEEIARVMQKDIWATNGIVYIIDRVLVLKNDVKREKKHKPSAYYQPPAHKKPMTVPTKNVPLNSMFKTFRTGRMGCGCGR